MGDRIVPLQALEAKKNDLILNFLQVSNRLNVVRNVSLKSIFWSEVPVAISELAARCHKLIFSLGEYKFSNIYFWLLYCHADECILSLLSV